MQDTRLVGFFEPLFYRFTEGYWPKECLNAEQLEDYLISNIRLDIRDLNQHVRRVLLDIRFQRKAQLVGALQDLFLVLGENGSPIKHNLLSRSRKLLAPEELAMFEAALDQYPNFVEHRSPYSFLA